MNRYIRAILGGILAILAAFGWTVALAFVLAPHRVTMPPLSNQGNAILTAIVLLIFSGGFYLAFRAAYRRISN
jgi:hypothetical protein